MPTGIENLGSLFGDVPDPNEPVQSAKGGRVGDSLADLVAKITATGLPPDKLIVAHVGGDTPPPPPTEADDDTKLTAEQILDRLANHNNGTNEWHRWSVLFPKDLLTDGAKAVADLCQAPWLMDLIGSWQHEPKVKREEFQSWYILVVEGEPPPKPWPGPGEALEECGNRWAWVWCEDGHDTDKSVVTVQLVPMTDFPLAVMPANLGIPRNPKTLTADERRIMRNHAFQLYACVNELGGKTILLPSEY